MAEQERREHRPLIQQTEMIILYLKAKVADGLHLQGGGRAAAALSEDREGIQYCPKGSFKECSQEGNMQQDLKLQLPCPRWVAWLLPDCSTQLS